MALKHAAQVQNVVPVRKNAALPAADVVLAALKNAAQEQNVVLMV